jgi:hypothetical protein
MKTTAIQFTAYGNTGLVQIMATPETILNVKPGGPEMKNGGLIINESNENGVVGKLTATNNTGSFLLLTDADVLIGAKQNRIINKSILLAPFSKTIIDVSCIERLRWHYNSSDFRSPDIAADHDLRKAKIASMLFKMNESMPVQNTQSVVWSHINHSLTEEHLTNETESYHEAVSFRMSQKAGDFPVCEAERGCTGLGVVVNGKVKCIDIFGTEELYKYYFPLLRNSAFRMAGTGKDIKQADKHESNFRVLESLDIFEMTERNSDQQYPGAGKLMMAERNGILGIELSIDEKRVHVVVFNK